MKDFLIPAAAVALLASAAFAQTVAPADTGPGAGPAATGDTQRDAGGPPPPPLGGPGPGLQGMAGVGHGFPPPPPLSKAPHVRIDRGNLHVDVKCGEDDSIKVCSDAAATLLDKIRSLPADPAVLDRKSP